MIFKVDEFLDNALNINGTEVEFSHSNDPYRSGTVIVRTKTIHVRI
jgi:hypothetical protein